MKQTLLLIAFIFWCIFTFLFAITIIPAFFILLREDSTCDTFMADEGDANWFKIGKKIINELVR